MIKIIASEDSGNSPKKKFALDFNIAFAKADIDTVVDCLTEDISWEVIGHEPLKGKALVAKEFKTMDEVADELIIHNVISHGDTCAINGVIKYPDISIAFCDIYLFSSHADDAKIKSITGYAITLKDN